jgi:hypothetical protein
VHFAALFFYISTSFSATIDWISFALCIAWKVVLISLLFGIEMALGPTQPPLHWVRGALSEKVKQPDYEFEHLPLSSAKVKEYEKLLHISLHVVNKGKFTYTVFLSNE